MACYCSRDGDIKHKLNLRMQTQTESQNAMEVQLMGEATLITSHIAKCCYTSVVHAKDTR